MATEKITQEIKKIKGYAIRKGGVGVFSAALSWRFP
jgi:hypothetical protein